MSRVDAAGTVLRVETPPRGVATLTATSRVYVDLQRTAPLGDLVGAAPTLSNAQPIVVYGAVDAVINLNGTDHVFAHESAREGQILRWAAADSAPQAVANTPILNGPPIVHGASIYFTAGIPSPVGAIAPYELWRYDIGTGARALSNLAKAGGSVERLTLDSQRGILYVVATRTPGQISLYRARGDSVELLTDLDDKGLPSFAMLSDKVLLCDGHTLWVTDGSVAGTQKLVLDSKLEIRDPCVAHAGLAYFSADDGKHGRELWRSDGTAAGTYLEADIAPGALGSDPGELLSAGGLLYFRANHPLYGEEPWVVR
jgi:ELWxxDGT repeat protein